MTINVNLLINTDNKDCDPEVCENNKYQHEFENFFFILQNHELGNSLTLEFKFGRFVDPQLWYTFIEAFENKKPAILIDPRPNGPLNGQNTPNIELTDIEVIFTLKTIMSGVTNDLGAKCELSHDICRSGFSCIKKYLNESVNKPCFPESEWALANSGFR